MALTIQAGGDEMKCKIVQRKLLSSAQQCQDEIAEHLRGCPDCRQFKRLLDETQSLKMVSEPGPKLDAMIRNYAAQAAAHRKTGSANTSPLPFFRFLRIAAAAAVVAVTLLLWHRHHEAGSADQTAELATLPAPSVQGWEDAGLAWSVLDAEMDNILADLRTGSQVSYMEGSSESKNGRRDFADGLDDQLFQLELEFYLEKESLSISSENNERG